MFVEEVLEIIRAELETNDLTSWGDETVKELAKVYEKYRGPKYSYTDATHVLFFTDTVREHDDRINMIKTFIECQ